MPTKIASKSDCARSSEQLRAAEHVLSIEFYESKFENQEAKLNCRIFSMHPLSELELKIFANRLNQAIEPVKRELAGLLQKEAMERIAATND